MKLPSGRPSLSEDDFYAAEREIARRAEGTHRSARAALSWALESEVRASSPRSCYPVTYKSPITGQQVRVVSDGGREFDLDAFLTATISILTCLERCGEAARLHRESKGRRPGAIPESAYPLMLRRWVGGVTGEAPPKLPGRTQPRAGSPWTLEHLAAHYGCHEATVSAHLGYALDALSRMLTDAGLVR